MKIFKKESIDLAKQIHRELLISEYIDEILYCEFKRLLVNVNQRDIIYKIVLFG